MLALVFIAGVIHDVTDFVDNHPVIRALISSGIVTYATALFNSEVHKNADAAQNLLSSILTGVVRNGAEVEI
ncbi:Acyl-CoA desaturase [Penicillium rolfsii]|nr:Acyl-CoA desaturase [Penicillium rolfsii]